ncbi:ABC transporter ATP-binding protein [Ensifer sp.]|jgi:iron complex transport system ATP-binding protein|uniref:ABC transporter ATP-binding protein n=1 Tax=Ensifer sp. TaxID=1872086 RepID=UPI002E0E4DC9|nr:ABC transporter ATP-binding protein [Ensifer sp.]
MLLKADDVTVRYAGHCALKTFSLGLGQGEIVALIGPNGSGKSTALHALAGLTRPDTGDVRLDGRSVRAWKRRHLARRLSFLPQAPLAPEGLTVAQLVRHGRFAHVGLFGSFTAEDRRAVEWALESTDLVDLADRDLRALSGGERQRAWIAAALAQEAAFLLLDEPTSFLDIGHQVEVLELLCRLRRERQMTVVVAIHDLNQAMAIADQIMLLARGETVFCGGARALSGSGLIEATFGVNGAFEHRQDGAGRVSFNAHIAI